MNKVRQYLFNLLIAVDQLANAVAGGHPDECISARLGRNYPNSFLRKFVDLFFGDDHCKNVNENGDGAKEVLK